MHYNYVAITTIVLLTIFSVVNSADSPETRCSAMSGTSSTGVPICVNCNEFDTCTNGVLSGTSMPCPPTQICDSTVSDGMCFTPTSGDVSPECFCQTAGCLIDPNNPSGYVNCNSGTSVIGTSVSCTLSQQVDLTTCQCATTTCPSCGLMASDNGNCSSTYHSCQIETNVFQCLNGLCYDSLTCSCETASSVCPTCGKYADPSSLDGTLYCVCDQTGNFFCGVTCPTGETFDAAICDCSSGSVSVCPTCGLRDEPSDCQTYYRCFSNGTIIDTYHCPGSQCFNEALCGCY